MFHGAAGACGSLGITTLVELQLIEAKRYVETTYHRVTSMPEAVETIQEMIKEDYPYDYADGILYSTDQGVVITGRLTDGTENNANDPWFYLHAKDTMSASAPVTEYFHLTSTFSAKADSGVYGGRRPADNTFWQTSRIEALSKTKIARTTTRDFSMSIYDYHQSSLQLSIHAQG